MATLRVIILLCTEYQTFSFAIYTISSSRNSERKDVERQDGSAESRMEIALSEIMMRRVAANHRTIFQIFSTNVTEWLLLEDG